jgi:CheR methyltransferase, SAM binding domain
MGKSSFGARLFVVLAAVSAAAASDRATRTVTLGDARPILSAVGDSVPAALRDRAGADADAAWSAWVRQRDADIRGRVARGDEDSVVNLMLYGIRFTRWPRATPDALAASSPDGGLDRVMDGRVADLAAAIESPGRDARLQFVRQVIERHGIAVGAPSREATRRYLVELRSRVLSENERYLRRRADADVADASQQRAIHATLYRDRGLSSDSSFHVDFALEQALAAVRDRGELTGRPVDRVAVIGPGLDFVDKAQGYDFYPVQMIQPFAVGDSLRRLGVAQRPAVTAFDISPRVIAHLRHARQRAARREPYRLNMLLEQDRAGSRVDPALVEYWRRFGEHLGTAAAADVPAEYAGRVRARAVHVRPEIVLDLSGAELNVVLERLSSAEATNRFDLVVATNVLVYYDTFEQALATGNMASMLREGGLLMTNQPVPVPAACALSPVLIMSVRFGQVEAGAGSRERGDSIFVYRKV